jgi:hypothetical protein
MSDSMKECKIINSRFSWILIVDGHSISFQGSENADYFKQHYENLGYSVIMYNDRNEE